MKDKTDEEAMRDITGKLLKLVIIIVDEYVDNPHVLGLLPAALVRTLSFVCISLGISHNDLVKCTLDTLEICWQERVKLQEKGMPLAKEEVKNG